MRIIFMGTPDYAAGMLRALLEAGHEVALVVTNPDKPAGRGGKVAFSPVKKLGLERGLEIYQPVRLRDAEAVERLRAVGAEVGVVAAFGQILSPEALEAPRLGCVNVHASLLPRYRGSSPIQQAILDGAAETGVTIMQMDAGVDTGDILLQEACPIGPGDTAGMLFDRLTSLGAGLLVRALALLERGELAPRRQDASLATKTGRIGKERGRIDWRQEAEQIGRQIRAMDPWPSAYTRLPDGRTLKLWRAEPVERRGAEPGCVCEVRGDSILVGCGRGALLVREVQLEGKRRMSVHDFLLGFPMQPGMGFHS